MVAMRKRRISLTVTPGARGLQWAPRGMKARRMAGMANRRVTKKVHRQRRMAEEWLRSVWTRDLAADLASNPASSTSLMMSRGPITLGSKST
jgi:hypothetical protein